MIDDELDEAPAPARRSRPAPNRAARARNASTAPGPAKAGRAKPRSAPKPASGPTPKQRAKPAPPAAGRSASTAKAAPRRNPRRPVADPASVSEPRATRPRSARGVAVLDGSEDFEAFAAQHGFDELDLINVDDVDAFMGRPSRATKPAARTRPGAERDEPRPRPRRRPAAAPRKTDRAQDVPGRTRAPKAAPKARVAKARSASAAKVRTAPSRRPARASRSPHAYRKVSGMRMTLITLFVLGGFAALLIKLADLQAVSPDRYAERARDQRMSVETLPATRGAIVDRNGEPLVTTVTRKTIYTDPANVAEADVPAMARALSPLLDVPIGTLEERLTAEGNFQYLARKVDEDVARRVLELGFDGIYTLDEATRLKPADDLALSVIGSVDTENVGISGLEKAFDPLLTGTPGEITQERSLGGDHTIPDGQQRVEPATPGSTLMLTLDRNLQQVVEKAVADQVNALNAKAGTAVVMDKSTGEILALASIVSGGKDGATNDEQNRAVTTTYEPGSVMKLVTMAQAIESGLVASWTVRNVPPQAEFYDYTFRDDQRFEDEKMTVTDILARSSNVGTMLLAKDLGEERLAEGIAGFGFGKATGIGVDNEEPGTVRALADWSGTSLPTMAIGQGLTATPLQLLAAYNTIANDGEYVSPTLVHSIVSPDGDDATRIVSNRHQVVSENTARQLQSMLATVVSAGTGVRASVPGYQVAGKTGTAWKARADGTYGANGDRDYLAAFVGFAPAVNPRFSIIVAIDEPQGGNYSGGLAAAPVFSTIARQALLSYDIPPDAEGWAQPADGTNLRARAAEAPPEPEPTVPMAADRPAGKPVANGPGGPSSPSTTAGANSAGRAVSAETGAGADTRPADADQPDADSVDTDPAGGDGGDGGGGSPTSTAAGAVADPSTTSRPTDPPGEATAPSPGQ